MKVLYISPYVPYKGIPHAGGYFLYEYLKRLSQHIDIEIVAPKSNENIVAVSKLEGELNVMLVGEEPPRKSLIKYSVNRIFNIIQHPLNTPVWHISVIEDFLRQEGFLEKYDLIELQWTQMLPLVSTIKEINQEIPVICFEHDVFTQSIKRRALNSSLSKSKILDYLRLINVESTEKKYLNQCDGIFTFSSKDKVYMEKMGITKNVDVMVPVFDIPPKPSPLDDQRCLFVGAMGRTENSEGIIWFIKNVWPLVLKNNPKSKLYIVGSSPPKELICDDEKNIIVTGFVEDLNQYYLNASVFIAPLFTGAGVKFKVLQAFAFGIPVISTPVGAEGICEGDNQLDVFPCITKDPFEFAQQITNILNNEVYRKNYGKKSRQWVLNNYNFNRNTIEKALNIYSNLINR